MVEFTVKEWLEIIDKNLDDINRNVLYMETKLGSALIMIGVLIWFSITNFLLFKSEQNLMILFISMVINSILFYTTHFLILLKCSSIFDRHPLYKQVTVENVVTIIKIKILLLKLLVVLMLLFNLHFFMVEPNYPFYFMMGVLTGIIILILWWISALLKHIFAPYRGLLMKLKFAILQGKMDDPKIIKKNYFAIFGIKSEE